MYLLECDTQNFVLIFNQKLRVSNCTYTIIHEYHNCIFTTCQCITGPSKLIPSQKNHWKWISMTEN